MYESSIARIVRSAGGLVLCLILLAPHSIARSQDRSTRARSRNTQDDNQVSRRLPNHSSARLAKMVTIYRDTYGIPHVFGRTDASTVFGFAFAQAEDNFWIQTSLADSQGYPRQSRSCISSRRGAALSRLPGEFGNSLSSRQVGHPISGADSLEGSSR